MPLCSTLSRSLISKGILVENLLIRSFQRILMGLFSVFEEG